MKKYFNIFLNLILIILLFNASYIKTANTQKTESDAKPLTHNEKIITYQIDDVLSMSTEELVIEVLKYPYLMDIFAYDSFTLGLLAIRNNFNAVRELFSRKDAGSALLSEYLSNEVITSAEGITNNEFFKISFLEIMLAQKEILEKLTKEELMILNKEAEIKSIQRISSSLYGFTADLFYNVVEEQGDFMQSTPYQFIHTPAGSMVRVRPVTTEHSLEEIARFDNQMAEKYPNAIKIRSASLKYNCHSYAWYSKSVDNNYWIEAYDADIGIYNLKHYKEDGSYRESEKWEKGNKIVYRERFQDPISGITRIEDCHSGIIVSMAPGTPHPVYSKLSLATVISKWGGYGLYIHNGIDCRYALNYYDAKAYTCNMDASHWKDSYKTYMDDFFNQHKVFCSTCEEFFGLEPHDWVFIHISGIALKRCIKCRLSYMP